MRGCRPIAGPIAPKMSSFGCWSVFRATSWDRALTVLKATSAEFVRAIDAVKKRVQRARHFVSWPGRQRDRRAKSRNGSSGASRSDKSAADRVLSPRQRTILSDTTRGYGVPEIATRLELSPARVSDEKYKAIRKLRSELTRIDELA